MVRGDDGWEIASHIEAAKWYPTPSFSELLTRVAETKQAGFAIDRGVMFQWLTLVSVPVMSAGWEPLLILSAAGHSHDLKSKALEPLCRAMRSAAARRSESVRLPRLE